MLSRIYLSFSYFKTLLRWHLLSQISSNNIVIHNYKTNTAMFPRCEAILSLSLVCVLFRCAASHTFLLRPRATKRGYDPSGCVGMSSRCTFCPPVYSSSELNNTADSPELTWSRGSRQKVRWAKNNHVGGFIRLSLVPISSLSDALAHERLAFYYGCWEQGVHRCGPNQLCGADKTRLALQRFITVPTYLPDGVYVLGFIWYGGVEFTGKKSKFPDFPSCSFVRIKGGARLDTEIRYRPIFDAGRRTHNGRQRTECRAYIDRPHVCTMMTLKGERCHNVDAKMMVARPFRNGVAPPRIHAGFFDARLRNNEPRLKNNDSRQDSGSESGQGEALCRLGVCCPAMCKTCGGRRCRFRPGGRESCCKAEIIKSKRPCDSFAPPCVMNGHVCNGNICCSNTCGTCGGPGCHQRLGGGDTCCTSAIARKGVLCNEGRSNAPCVVRK